MRVCFLVITTNSWAQFYEPHPAELFRPHCAFSVSFSLRGPRTCLLILVVPKKFFSVNCLQMQGTRVSLENSLEKFRKLFPLEGRSNSKTSELLNVDISVYWTIRGPNGKGSELSHARWWIQFKLYAQFSALVTFARLCQQS